MENKIEDDTRHHRYTMNENGQTVFTTYRREGDLVQLLHVEAPEALRGTGAAGRFMQALMEHLRAQKLKAVPVCSYAVSWLERHKEFHDLIKNP